MDFSEIISDTGTGQDDDACWERLKNDRAARRAFLARRALENGPDAGAWGPPETGAEWAHREAGRRNMAYREWLARGETRESARPVVGRGARLRESAVVAGDKRMPPPRSSLPRGWAEASDEQRAIWRAGPIRHGG